jgi:hypothetical protein
VENVSPKWNEGEGWTLSQEPFLEIGAVEDAPAYMLSQIVSPRMLSDGGVALIDFASTEVRLFDASGRHLRSMGRAGQGPGEFIVPGNLTVFPGDSIGVWDVVGRRMTVFSQDGSVGRVFSLEPHPSAFQRPEFLHLFPNGDILANGVPTPDEQTVVQTGMRWSQSVLLKYSSNGENPVVLAEVDRGACDPRREGECSGIAYGAPRSVSLHKDRIVRSHPDRNEFVISDNNDVPFLIVRGAAPLEPITDLMRTEFREAVIAGSAGTAASRAAFVDRAYFPENVPGYSSFLISETGDIWAREFHIESSFFGFPPVFPPRTTPTRWTVYDSDGIQLGDVESPLDFAILEVGSAYVLGIGRGEFDVQRIQVFGLIKP